MLTKGPRPAALSAPGASAADPAADPARAAAGLTTDAARRALLHHGANEVTEPKRHPVAIFLGHLWAPVPWMLEAAVLLQALIGERLEAAIIVGLLLFNAALSYVQDARAHQALVALKSRLALTASVRRDGAWVTLPVREVVPGDVVKLSLGAVVPADVSLLSGSVLLDQSMLTGESLPVEAEAGRNTFAGVMVRRGEAQALVTATGASTYFGKTAELVRLARPESAEQSAILRVVRNLAVLNGLVLVFMVAYAYGYGMPPAHVVAMALTVILASVPVALPATFTLATALGAQRLVGRGVLPTRLSAVHEVAAMDVLCSDKTGTLTRNELEVTSVRAFPGFDGAQVLALAAAASSEGGNDPVDAAIRAAARRAGAVPVTVRRFVPFDPAAKYAEASVGHDGGDWRVVKGAFAAVSPLAETPKGAGGAMEQLAGQGNRVLAVASGPPGQLRLAGLVGLSDPARSDAAPLIAELETLGVGTVMVTGDAAPTASVVARAIGLGGAVCAPGQIPDVVKPSDYSVFAGVFPADKFHLVKAFQKAGHTVGMCGDGANDAPALRQAQIGIAVSTATDVAKSAAGLVLTEPGLGGIVAAIKEGRATFQRILTYTLNTLIKKIEIVLFLGAGLVMTGHTVLSPILMVVLLVTNDFLTMSLTTDRARPSLRPDRWRIGAITAAAVTLGLVKLAFSTGLLAVAAFGLGLPIDKLRTFAFLTVVFGAQATVYVIRERRRLWSSRPSAWIMLSSAIDLAIAGAIGLGGALTPALPVAVVLGLLVASVGFAFMLDTVKRPVFGRLGII